jgi:serine/threonine protein kinase
MPNAITQPIPQTPPGGSVKRSRWKTLPADMLRQSCHRVGIMTLVIAALWAMTLLMNNVVAPLIGHKHTAMMRMQWISPGNQISTIGLAVSVLMLVLVWGFRGRPQLLLDASLVFEIVTAALIATLMHWVPVIDGSGGISWLCLIILTFPVIVPSPPWKTLLVSMIVATMDPIAVGIAALRGVPIQADAFVLLWYFLPNYISVALAMIPSHIIGGMGREVRMARELGAYQLGELLGRGGMGEVYLANHRMLARPAAIKLIRPETLGAGQSNGTDLAIRRFRREAQAAALLRSPHTVHLYDFGVTDDGTFYYVMELLEGADLESLVNRFGPVPPERAVHLLRHACHSLSEAHARGLIHRDIKPSNILVTLHDGVPVPKVIDFGIAKATEQRLTDKTLFTSYAQLMGTPAYMSPEQMELSGLNLDTRSDIYSLGVLLYELLTGRTPFDTADLLKLGVDELRRTLREQEPLSPSAKLQTLNNEELTKTAMRRHVEPPRLLSQLRGDLDWIVLKCLEKDRTRRYATANGVAMDIQRYLHEEAVLARPPSQLYRLQKLVRRNRIVFLFGAAAVAALLLGTIFSTLMFFKEREARTSEARLRREAELRERASHVALLVTQRRFEEADKLVAGLPLNKPSIEVASELRALGDWHATKGRWPQAAERFGALAKVNQRNFPQLSLFQMQEQPAGRGRRVLEELSAPILSFRARYDFPRATDQRLHELRINAKKLR